MSNPLPVVRAHCLAERAPEKRWLVEGLWADEAVGIVGGEPKSCKSFLALDLAVAVASGTPCLRHFPVRRQGRVLLYAAEDALHVVKERLEGICHAAGVALRDLDILVITEHALRLDLERQARSLQNTVEKYRPTLLTLDPFVRLHRIDENASGEVAPILSFLRTLQQQAHTAVVLVHHARKSGARRPGQSLRGSSEFHAWGDSNLYLQRHGEMLQLTTEHRSASGTPSVGLALRPNQRGVALTVETAPGEVIEAKAMPPTPEQRVMEVLAGEIAPLAMEEIRSACRLRKATVCEVLATLVEDGVVARDGGRYRLRDGRFPVPVPVDPKATREPELGTEAGSRRGA